MDCREYNISIMVNEILISKVIIDPDDEKTPYAYFVTDKIESGGKLYKLIWMLENHEIYIGVINAYRR